MTSDEQTLDVIKNFISHLKGEEQDEVRDVSDCIRAVVKGRGAAGLIALSLIGAEFAAGKYD